MFATPSLLLFMVGVCPFAAGQQLLDLNPDLGPFQDESECFPLEQSWHLMYRDFESDPYLGGKAKCVKGIQTNDFVEDSTVVVFEYPPDGVLNTTFKLMSSPGYTAKNVLNVVPMDNPNVSINLTIAFRDCHSCKVIRHSYIEQGTGCSMWVSDAEINQAHPCCSYVFELLCGFKETYQIYDKSCS
uniref:Putative lipocal-1 1 n=1 Tax=Amblyomma triste TaxID=251400 RepID=A0A023GCZ2_AMBTT